MTETIRLVLTNFTDEAITLSMLVLLVVIALLISYWIYNRRRFQKLTHQIPASVVKNYLDSIIQNSTALKSSLFRGGGLDVGTGIPSVFPTSDLPGRGPIGISTGASEEELNQKVAEIQALNRKLADKDSLIKDLEKNIGQPKATNAEELKSLQAEIERLKNELKNSSESLGDEKEQEKILKEELRTVSQERDEYKERLMEYEIIEEDLANLKKLQQENEQMRKTLELLQGGAPVVEEVAKEQLGQEEVTEENIDALMDILEEKTAEAPVEREEVSEPLVAEDDFEAEMAKAMETPATVEAPAKKEESVEQKKEDSAEKRSAEELLSEFEKMLS